MTAKFDRAAVVDRLKFMLAAAGWPGIAGAALLLAGAGAEFVALPQQQAIAAGNRQAAERAHQDYVQAAAGEHQGRMGSADLLAKFRDRLTADKDADAVFETLQRDAQRNGLAPTGTEYKWQREAGAGLAEVKIVMPVKAAYAPLRAFVKDVLTDVPGLALDQFDIQRDNIGATTVDARLRFSLYLKTGT